MSTTTGTDHRFRF